MVDTQSPITFTEFIGSDESLKVCNYRAVVDPLLDWIVWTQLLLVTIICLDRACHICRPLHYNLKPWLMVLCVLICPAIPFFTLTLPYILAARAIMRNEEEKWMDRTKAFICSTFKFYIDGDHKYNNKIFMSMCKVVA